jgi:tetratricopeptide (TPR) repeat protein
VRVRVLFALCVLVTSGLIAQDTPSKPADSKPPDSDSQSQESSSRDSRVDVSPPQDDSKNHPNSESAVSDLTPKPPSDTTGVQEFHTFEPMKSKKDIDVGDFYFRRKNYKAALDRYKEALYYKENDALATYRIAVCQEKLGDKAEARMFYEQYLKLLPEGPLAKDAHAALNRIAKAR